MTADKTDNSRFLELRHKLAGFIAQHAPQNGEGPCAISDLFLTRRTVANGCQGNFEPSLMVFAQGKKDVRLGAETYHCDSDSFLLSSVALPLGGLVVHATQQAPLLLFRLTLNMHMVREMIASKLLPATAGRFDGTAIAKGVTTVGLMEACVRLLALLDSPEDIPYLGPLAQQEILYRLMCLPQGASLRSVATTGNTSNRIAEAVTWVKKHFSEPLNVSELAVTAGVSQSTLNARFRSLTGMSPLQYQKQLRLFAAQDRMMIGGEDASTAAFTVGYESVSQFNREYRRYFGQPPMAHVRARRTTTAMRAVSSS